MTGRERIHAALKGEPLDRVPFAINLWNWFYAQKHWGWLADDKKHLQTPIEFLIDIGADILSRWDGQIKGRAGLGDYVQFPNGKLEKWFTGDKPPKPIVTAFNTYTEGTKVHQRLETPHGELTQTWRFTEESCADFEEKYWVDDFDKQYDVVKFIFEDRTYAYELDEYRRDIAAIGEHGVVMVEIPENPFKTLHWLCGPEKAILAIMDYPERAAELCEIHAAKTCEFVREVCKRTTYDETPLLMSNDNLDAMLFPPFMFEEYLYKYYRAVADEVHKHGRLFCVHSCGNNWDIRHCIRDSGIDMMEGLTPPDLGNFPLEKARSEMGSNFIIEGGMYCYHQEIKKGAREAIDDYTRTLFDGMGDKQRFIYASSCTTSPLTSYDNVLHFRDSCWRHGKMGG